MPSSPASGAIVIDKPVGPTSHDVVAAIRKLLRPARAGHTGTLDPLASGVLAICLGAATRLSRYLSRGPKVYAGRLLLGITTDTYDTAGTVLVRRPSGGIDLEEVRSAAAGLTGDLMQVPPPWSAKRVEGRRAYDLARVGRAQALPPCHVRVDRFAVTGSFPEGVDFEVECSTGTYIRSLVHDLGERLGCGASLAALRRLRSGPFVLGQAVTLDLLEGDRRGEALAGALIPPEGLDLGMGTARLTATGVRHALAGRRIPSEELSEVPADPGQVRLIDPSGRLVGIGEASGGPSGGVHPRVVLPEPC